MEDKEKKPISWYLEQIPNHLKPGFNASDMDWLLNCSIKLSTLLADLAQEVSEAKFNEYSSAVTYMDAVATESAKKMSNAEAEKRALVDTKNEYQKLDLFKEAVIETIHSIKKKVDTYSQLTKVGA